MFYLMGVDIAQEQLFWFMRSQMKLILLVARECLKLQAWRMVYSDEDLRLTSNFIYCAFNVLYILLIIMFKLQSKPIGELWFIQVKAVKQPCASISMSYILVVKDS